MTKRPTPIYRVGIDKVHDVNSTRMLKEVWRRDTGDPPPPSVEQVNLVQVQGDGQSAAEHRHPQGSGLWETFIHLSSHSDMRITVRTGPGDYTDYQLHQYDSLSIPPGYWHAVYCSPFATYLELRSTTYPSPNMVNEKEFWNGS